MARLIYGNRPDTRNQACIEVLKTVAKCQIPNSSIAISTDAKKVYPSLIAQVIPNAVHNSTANRIAHAGGSFKPMFALNLTAAKIRHDLSRMVRKTWVTTKEIWGLEDHLMLYVAWNNNYPIFQQKNGMVL